MTIGSVTTITYGILKDYDTLLEWKWNLLDLTMSILDLSTVIRDLYLSTLDLYWSLRFHQICTRSSLSILDLYMIIRPLPDLYKICTLSVHNILALATSVHKRQQFYRICTPFHSNERPYTTPKTRRMTSWDMGVTRSLLVLPSILQDAVTSKQTTLSDFHGFLILLGSFHNRDRYGQNILVALRQILWQLVSYFVSSSPPSFM